jgi:hypothetical protein
MKPIREYFIGIGRDPRALKRKSWAHLEILKL